MCPVYILVSCDMLLKVVKVQPTLNVIFAEFLLIKMYAAEIRSKNYIAPAVPVRSGNIYNNFPDPSAPQPSQDYLDIPVGSSNIGR